MKRILSIMLVSFMLLSLVSCKDASEETMAKQIAPEEVYGFFEEVTLPKNESTEPSTPTDSPDLELPGEGNSLELDEQNALSGFSIKEKRFTYEYKDYILFDVTNETDKNYNLTVHAKYFDAEGKRLDETWEVYSDFASGHQQYILLDPGKKFAECKYDFQLKETESDCWRSKVRVESTGMHAITVVSTSYLSLDFQVKNDALRIIHIKLKGILIFDSKGEIYEVRQHGILKEYPSKNPNEFNTILDECSSNEDLEIPKELQDGYTAIAVIESITEE